MSSARESILASVRKCEPIEVFGGKHSVRVISGRELSAFHAWSKAHPDNKGFREYLVSLFLGDEQGNRIFTDIDVDALANLDARDLEAVASAGLKLNKMLPESYEDTKKA